MAKKFYHKNEIDTITEHFNLKDYFRHLESKGKMSYLFKSGKDEYYTDITKEHKYSVGNKSYYDFKTGEGQGSIKAIQKFENIDFPDALTFAKEFSNTFIPNEIQAERKRTDSETTAQKPDITNILPPTNPALLSYFEKRGISAEVLSQFSQQVHYQHTQQGTNAVKNYFGIGLKNESGGYDIRNPYAKVKLGKSDISIVSPEKAAKGIIVFEGMTDLLSFAELQKHNGTENSKALISLNSVVNVDLFLDRFADYKGRVLLCLDGDEEGSKATAKIAEKLPNNRDIRSMYDISNEGNNDLNDYLQNKLLISKNVQQYISTTNENTAAQRPISDFVQNGRTGINEEANRISQAEQSILEFPDEDTPTMGSQYAGDGLATGGGERPLSEEENAVGGQQNGAEQDSEQSGAVDNRGNGDRAGRILTTTNVPEVDLLLSKIYDQKRNNESIAELVRMATFVDVNDRVKLTAGLTITDELLEVINDFRSGGVEKKGRGILDEYYTEDNLVEAVYNLVHGLLPQDRRLNALEPSSGTGNFIKVFSTNPNIRFTGFEINEDTARISKLRNPDADINLRSYETNFIGHTGEKKPVYEQYDLIVGNPPYGAHRGFYKGLGEEVGIGRYEDYFVKRSLDEAKEGAIVAMVLPSTYLNRMQEIKDSQLLAAYRLPSGAFKGTQVGTDIVILQKQENEIEYGAKTYFLRNPDHVLGDIAEKTNRFGKTELYVKGSLEDALASLQDLQRENPLTLDNPAKRTAEEMFSEGNRIKARAGGYEFTLLSEVDPGQWEARGSSGVKIIFSNDADNYELIESYNKEEITHDAEIVELTDKPEPEVELEEVPIKAEKEQIIDEIDSLIDSLAGAKFKSPLLQRTIDNLQINKGQINNGSLSPEDVSEVRNKVRGIGKKYSNDQSGNTYKQITTLDFSKKHLKYEFKKPDAIVPASVHNDISLSHEEIAAFKDADYNGVLANPEQHLNFANLYKGQYIHDFYYVEGNIHEKIEQLNRDFDGRLDDPTFRNLHDKQLNALLAVLPAEKSLENIILSPNHEFVHNFPMGVKDKLVYNHEKRETELIPNVPYSLAEGFKDFVGTLPNQAFEGSSSWEVKGYVDNEQVTGADKERNALVRERRKDAANNLFRKFLQEEISPEHRTAIVQAFNRKYNNLYVPNYAHFPLFSKIHENFKGSPLQLTEVQKSGIGRNTTKGVGLLAHEVGFGKTLSGVLSMHEAMTRGTASRPLIVVPNSNILKQWAETIFEIIPEAKVNILGNLGKDYDLSKFQMNDNEITLVTYEGFNNIGFNQNLTSAMAEKFSYISETEMSSLKSISERDIQIAAEQQNEIEGKMKKGKLYDWEDFGFDHLTFDEVHNANHIVGKVKIEDRRFSSDFRSQNQRTSSLGINTWMAAQYIQKKNNGRNVSLLSATPFTNKPLEYYSILSLIANKKLEEMGYFNVNNFFETFMEADNDMEINAKGDVNFKMSIRRFKNNDIFQKLLSEFIDIKGEADNPNLVRPERHNREFKIEQNDLTKEQYELLNENYNDAEPGAVLTHILNGRLIAISPYLSPYNREEYSPKEFVENSPKLDLTMRLIAQNKKDIDAGQIIYSELAVAKFPLLKDYLVNEIGYQDSEVEMITGKITKAQKDRIQEDFNNGKVKVIIGSEAIQEGLNLQKNTSDIYLLSLPYNFTSLRQVEGRAWRQGNINSNVRMNYMLTNDSIDVFMLQKLQDKQNRYLEAIQGGKDVLDVSDINTLELKTALITNPATRASIEIKLKEKEIDVAKTKLQSDSAFFLRKFEKFNKENEMLTKLYSEMDRFKEWASGGMTYYDSMISRQQDLIDKQVARITEVREDLKSQGVDVTIIDDKIKETDEKIAELDLQKEKLPELELDLIFKYEKEKEASKVEYNIDALVTERHTENKTLFSQSHEKLLAEKENIFVDKKTENLNQESDYISR